VFDPKHHTAPIIIMAYDSNNAALRCAFLLTPRLFNSAAALGS
jgi:hypothetical protein